MGEIKNSIIIFVFFTVLLGLVYPLVITGISQLAFPEQANGNLIEVNGTVVGSSLIGQEFTSPQYFHGRPSAVDYNSSSSSGSNLGPTNQKLIDNVNQTMETIIKDNSLQPGSTVPADLVETSASGLEGYIYVDSAMIQVPRIAGARNISESSVVKIIEDNKEVPLGTNTPIVNVLKLNIALDKL
ncbi:MAG TPA: potassium-transporting ATPase subunit KdpC [Methanobacterium sp.]|nr:potassium-transporting ATPase subunit KdpC [Methanobacterium sp.]